MARFCAGLPVYGAILWEGVHKIAPWKIPPAQNRAGDGGGGLGVRSWAGAELAGGADAHFFEVVDHVGRVCVDAVGAGRLQHWYVGEGGSLRRCDSAVSVANRLLVA